jgi:hypothetical protein
MELKWNGGIGVEFPLYSSIPLQSTNAQTNPSGYLNTPVKYEKSEFELMGAVIWLGSGRI